MSRYILVTTNWANVIVRKISFNVNLQLFFISNNNILSILSTRTFLAYETKTNCYFKEKAHILE